MKNLPLLTFIKRNWILLILFIISDKIAVSEEHYKILGKWVSDPDLGGIWKPQTPMEYVGPVLWVLPFGLAIYLMGRLIIHLSYRKTIDADAHSGKDAIDWRYLTPFERAKLRTQVYVGIFIGLCILCSGLAR